MKTILITIALTSVCWLVLLAYVLIQNYVKNKELKRKLAAAIYSADALQIQFERFKKNYEKMETGNANNDFLASLDILQNGGQNTTDTATTARSNTDKSRRHKSSKND